jgi:hypothetical protein
MSKEPKTPKKFADSPKQKAAFHRLFERALGGLARKPKAK